MMRIASVLLLAACISEREPGPHSFEESKVTFWEVVASEGSTVQCTDSADWSEVVSGPIVIPGSYLMYRVEPGGNLATGQSCG